MGFRDHAKSERACYNGAVSVPLRPWMWSIVLVLVGCSPDGLLVQVEGDVDVDSLSIEAYLPGQPAAVLRQSLGSTDGLSQSFLVRAGEMSSASGSVRLLVHGYREGVLVASGGVRTAVDAEAVTVRLTETCSRQVCGGLMLCDPAGPSCDGYCVSDADCASVGCVETACVDGTCVGEGADADGDGQRDARCPLGASNLDCDDQEALAGPETDQPRCGDHRDHECDLFADELELCPGCNGDRFSLTTVSVPLPETVRAVAGPRETPGGDAVFAATATAIYLIEIGADGVGEVLAQEPADDIRDLFLVGPLLAAATREGLALFDVTSEPTMRALGQPLPVPPADPVALSAVTVARGTAWVSGDGMALATVDIRNPSNPRFIGATPGPAAPRLAPFRGGVVATGTADAALRLFPATMLAAPSPAVDSTGGLAGESASAVLTRAPRTTAGEEDVVVMAGSQSAVFVFDRGPGGALRRLAEAPVAGPVVGLWLDEALAVAVARDGTLTVLPREAAAGSLGAPTFIETLDDVDSVVDVDFTTGTAGALEIVLGGDERVVFTELACLE
jgi:hypothetical protein